MQNTSHAVMAQRREPMDSLDDFPTPPWAARALCEHVIKVKKSDSVWEPASNRGFLLRGLGDYFGAMHASDIHDYGGGFPIRDFLFPGPYPISDWIITNPPFRLAEQFARAALERAQKGIALLTRTAFLEGGRRHADLFSVTPPLIVAQFVERVPMVKGRCDPKASTATSYCWVIWTKDLNPTSGTQFLWIPPCRRQLERDGDYSFLS